MTSILRVKRALEEYDDVVTVATAISQKAVQAKFEFLFYIEDNRGGSAVGVKGVKASVVMPFHEQATRTVFMPTDLASRDAFKGHLRESLRCSLTVHLHNTSEANVYEFDSGPLEKSNKMIFADTTPRIAPIEHWKYLPDNDKPPTDNDPKQFTIFVRFSSAKDSMTIEHLRFTFTPSKHPELVQLLSDEARETRIDTALALVTKARKLDINVASD